MINLTLRQLRWRIIVSLYLLVSLRKYGIGEVIAY
jgi:hypothetical protein